MPSHLRRAWRAHVTAWAFALFSGLAGLSAAAPALGQDYPSLIRIGSAAPGNLKFHLHQHHGWLADAYAELGIELELVTFAGGGAEAAAALATGSLPLTYNGFNPALRLAAAGGDAKLVGLAAWDPTVGSGIVVRADSDIETLEDLEGKKIAYLTGTNRHSTLSKALDLVGLTTNDIESLHLNIDASGPALLRGDIDAIVESDNTVQRLIDTGEVRRLFDGNDYPEWSVPGAILANGTFAEQFPELVEIFLAVDLRIAQWADDNYEETIAIYVAGAGVSEQTVRDNFRGGVFYQDPSLSEAAVAALAEEEKFMAENDLLTGSVDYDAWVDFSYIEAAKARLEAESEEAP